MEYAPLIVSILKIGLVWRDFGTGPGEARTEVFGVKSSEFWVKTHLAKRILSINISLK